MADKILLKRADTPGKVPAAGDLTPGELAVNTADGLLYTKKDSGEVVAVGGLAPILTLDSAATVDIGAANANTLRISGTTTITSLGTIASGATRVLIFQDALTLTHNATSLILPYAANVTTEAGLVAEFVSLGSGNWRCTRMLFATTATARAAMNTASKAGDTYSGIHNFASGEVRFTGANGYGQVARGTSNGGLKLASVATAAGHSAIDIDGASFDGTSSLGVRFFRALNTTGGGFFEFYQGNGSSTLVHRIASTGLVTLNRTAGETVIGATASNGTDKLQVSGSIIATGAIKLATFTLATLPSASANTRGMVYCSNLSGQAAPVYSDGTNWRRVSDNTIAD